MTTSAEFIEIDGKHVPQDLLAARETLGSANDELVLDFSSVPRIDAAGLTALEALAGAADGKGVKLRLRGVKVDVYKVLKLVQLTSRFCFSS